MTDFGSLLRACAKSGESKRYLTYISSEFISGLRPVERGRPYSLCF